MGTDILSVDTKGLSKLSSRNGLDWIVRELVQDAWDQDVTEVNMTIDSAGHSRGRIVIKDDDPEGFLDLSHAYTLFVESNKGVDPTLRGRFNLGLKLVIAYCIETGGSVEILTTSGGYFFSKKDGRKKLRTKTEKGSQITAIFRASKSELAQIENSARMLISPCNFPTYINGTKLSVRDAYGAVEAALPTVVVNDDGDFFKTVRKTTVEVYETFNGETSMIYEMGIPVVENPTPYHINVLQKVPLNFERDSVTRSYSQAVCALTANIVRTELTAEEAAKPWVSQAMESDEIEADTVKKILDKKHGTKRVMHDPSNPEASAAAIASGYTVVYGRSYSKDAHEKIKSLSPVTSATKKFKDAGVEFSSDGKDVTISRDKWTHGMNLLAEYTERLHEVVHGRSCDVQWVNDPRGYAACYGDGGLVAGVTLNKRRLGTKWINDAVQTEGGFRKFLDICIHEFAHLHSDSHYSDDFYNGCTRIGSKVAMFLAKNGLPDWIK